MIVHVIITCYRNSYVIVYTNMAMPPGPILVQFQRFGPILHILVWLAHHLLPTELLTVLSHHRQSGCHSR